MANKKNNNTSKKLSPNTICNIIVLILIVAIALTAVIGYFSNGFKNMDAKEWNKEQQQTSGVFDESGAELQINEINNMPKNMVFTPSALASVRPPIKIKATIEPSYATVKDVDWFLVWNCMKHNVEFNHFPQDCSCAGNNNRSVDQYVSIKDTDIDTCTVQAEQAFDEIIWIICVSRDNPKVKAECRIDYSGEISLKSANLFSHYYDDTALSPGGDPVYFSNAAASNCKINLMDSSVVDGATKLLEFDYYDSNRHDNRIDLEIVLLRTRICTVEPFYGTAGTELSIELSPTYIAGLAGVLDRDTETVNSSRKTDNTPSSHFYRLCKTGDTPNEDTIIDKQFNDIDHDYYGSIEIMNYVIEAEDGISLALIKDFAVKVFKASSHPGAVQEIERAVDSFWGQETQIFLVSINSNGSFLDSIQFFISPHHSVELIILDKNQSNF